MGKMESRLALCLWICFIVCASTSNGCSELPVVEYAEVAETFKKAQYSEGDTLEYNCVQGYTSRIKIIYKCSNNKWSKFRGEECSLKRCESPEDIPNGRYIIKSGKAFFFGTVIQYVCTEGYQTMGRSDTRTCRDGGWDNQLPACEEVTCERIKAEGNLRVDGLPDDPEDLIRFGHRLTLSCTGAGLNLEGKKEITCQSNGEWSSPNPKCVEGCKRVNADEHLRVEGLPDHPEKLNRYGERLTFSCEGPGVRLQGEEVITCKSNGEWSSQRPTCLAIVVTCEERQHFSADILIGHPHTAPPYKPGHVLAFHCTDIKMDIEGQRVIECLPNGKWDHPYPKCEATKVTCEEEKMIAVDFLTGSPGIAPPYKPGHILVFRCTDVNLKMHGQRAIKCLSNGKWDHPYPECKEHTCEVPHDQHVSRPSSSFRGDMKLGSKQYYSCETGYEKTAEEATCTRDGWTPKPLCAKSTCDVPRNQNVYRPYEYFREDMKLGSKQYYICETGYEIMAEEATCTRDGWTPNPLCADIRCEVPLDQHVSRPSSSFRGDMKLGARKTYYCESGYEKAAQQATCTRDGWAPKPLCTKSTCEVPHDQHVSRPSSSFRGDMKLGARRSYYCESGYEKTAEEATCTRDGWTPNPLCAVMTVSGKCEPPPPVDNADTVEMAKKEYNTGERVEFACFNKYKLDLQRSFGRYLTCQRGQWRGSVRCLKPCTVTKELMNERGIDLAYADDPKMFAPHNDYITFKCLWGKVSVDYYFDFRQKCNDGEMTLPRCV